MSAERYAAMARKHWTKWLPEKVAELKAAGDWESTLRTRGKWAAERVLELMQQGYQQHEAEEVALSELILLKPEPKANLESWERKELSALEREYRKTHRE
ncbi:hypothetical protein ACUTAH_08970 [Metapseudomonas furukawaii]|uniref:hypothetical protein n=1 Tax=Metapseudomonas furukawaii TaxID=1149133 RepID=UPI0040451E29